jgi:hypothetical protein
MFHGHNEAKSTKSMCNYAGSDGIIVCARTCMKPDWRSGCKELKLDLRFLSLDCGLFYDAVCISCCRHQWRSKSSVDNTSVTT